MGTSLLSLYFGVGFSSGIAQLFFTATIAQVVSAATQYHTLWFLGTWLQATGVLLSVVFFLARVQKAGATARLAGLFTIVGSAVLLAVVLIEGVFTLDLAQAAESGLVATITLFVRVEPVSHATEKVNLGSRPIG